MPTETTTSLRAVLLATVLSWIILAAGTVNAATIASFADPMVGMSPIPYLFEIRDGAPTGVLGPGHFEFIKDSDVLLRVHFDSAYLTTHAGADWSG